jgi:hypothetical protein
VWFPIIVYDPNQVMYLFLHKFLATEFAIFTLERHVTLRVDMMIEAAIETPLLVHSLSPLCRHTKLLSHFCFMYWYGYRYK